VFERSKNKFGTTDVYEKVVVNTIRIVFL